MLKDLFLALRESRFQAHKIAITEFESSTHHTFIPRWMPSCHDLLLVTFLTVVLRSGADADMLCLTPASLLLISVFICVAPTQAGLARSSRSTFYFYVRHIIHIYDSFQFANVQAVPYYWTLHAYTGWPRTPVLCVLKCDVDLRHWFSSGPHPGFSKLNCNAAWELGQ